uniref:TNFR-Cys domain-containing protein n=1 Tax=Callorhinchus milii TaxID=7868 RepID=A0A4W3HQU8_CALMI
MTNTFACWFLSPTYCSSADLSLVREYRCPELSEGSVCVCVWVCALLVRMAGPCAKNSYFDQLTSACELCELRCSNLQSQPAACKGFTCNSNICLSILKSAEITVDRNIIVASIVENGLAEEVTDDVQEYPTERIRQSEKFLQSNATNCTSPENQMKDFIHSTQSSGGYDATFPLPATEEGSTVLVTTKTMEWCGYQKV